MRSFREPDEIHERTPTREEVGEIAKMPGPFRDFVKLLRASEMRFVKPKPLETALKYHCSENTSSYLHSLGNDEKLNYSIVFGFVVYIDPGCGFFRANGHIWLQNDKTGEWVDPTPICDPGVDEELLLVRSEHFLTRQEREFVIASPNSYALGAMVSHSIVPPGLDKMDPRMRVVGMMFHLINKPAEEMRLYSLSDNPFGGLEAKGNGAGAAITTQPVSFGGREKVPGCMFKPIPSPLVTPSLMDPSLSLSPLSRTVSFRTQFSDESERERDVTDTEVARIMRQMSISCGDDAPGPSGP